MHSRPPAVAGMFYPAAASTLAGLVDRMVGAVSVPEGDQLAEAYIVPHAGYRFSGPVAAEVYARLRGRAAEIGRVVLIGPAHRVPLTGCAVTGAARWRTPLGEVPVDPRAGAVVDTQVGVVVDDRAHAQEHSLEVQVPFLQRVLDPGFVILPICVGRSSPERVAEVIAAAGGGEAGTVVLCSTDFSHYLPDDQARERDRQTAAAVVELSPERIDPYAACGSFALCGLLQWARSEPRGIPEVLALTTSAEAGGDPGRVVGYPAFALRRPPMPAAPFPSEPAAQPDQPV